MKIHITSDIHLEFDSKRRVHNTMGADLLILSGDIFVAADLDRPITSTKSYMRNDIIEFFNTVSKEFQHIILIMGNHEHYHGKFPLTANIIRDFIAQWENIHFLDNECIDIDGEVIFGGTLWTNYNNGNGVVMHLARHYLNDYRTISNGESSYPQLQAETVYKNHLEALHTIKMSKPTLVVTHHAPHVKSIAQEYLGDYNTNPYYYSDLDEFICNNPNIKLWAHGHMHSSSDYLVSTTRVIANPMGYPFTQGSNKNYNPSLLIEV